MKLSLDQSTNDKILGKLQPANKDFAQRFPGESPLRQPVHTVYGGAHLFKSDSAVKLGAVSLNFMKEYAPNFVVFAKALHLPDYDKLPTDELQISKLEEELRSGKLTPFSASAHLPYNVYVRVMEKLKREPVEDFRIDFEDGYGNRADSEEDGHAAQAAQEVAAGMANKTLPPFIGIRVKPFTEELKVRSARTLDIFISTLLAETKNKLPHNFVVTLPKVTIPQQVTALVELFQALEHKNKLPAGTLKLELMVETTQSIISHSGKITLPSLVEAAQGLCTGAHFGVYDYTASCSITAFHQTLDHPACDFARSVMKVALGGTEIWLSDGATNIMPIGPHKAMPGQSLTAEQQRENIEVVHRAWKLNFDHVSHSLRNAFYQGWDLHPAQFPIRYAACYSFFLEGLDSASMRLSSFMDKAARATLLGDVFDDAATGQGLLNYFLRALNCGAITEDEVKATSLTLEEVRGRSFAKIVADRRKHEKVLT